MALKDLLDISKLMGTERPLVRLVPGGNAYVVRMPNGAVFRKIELVRAMEPGMGQAIAYFDLVKMLIPEAPDAEVDALTPDQLLPIIELASAPIEAATRYAHLRADARNPNGTGDETNGPPSSPTTGSAMSAIGSPTPPGSP